MPKACSDRSPRTADAGIYDGMGVLCPWFLREGSDRATADGVFAKRMLSDNGVREADLCLEKTRRAARLIAAAISAGQSGLLCSGLLSVLVLVG